MKNATRDTRFVNWIKKSGCVLKIIHMSTTNTLSLLMKLNDDRFIQSIASEIDWFLELYDLKLKLSQFLGILRVFGKKN